ncbi:MAG: hypothetical protein JW700_01580 [Candidatus Aenigmarchaeota archaeon]|nr:hypothetical protein [Candidatus Aenigmarchaeota archaeon]
MTEWFNKRSVYEIAGLAVRGANQMQTPEGSSIKYLAGCANTGDSYFSKKILPRLLEGKVLEMSGDKIVPGKKSEEFIKRFDFLDEAFKLSDMKA